MRASRRTPPLILLLSAIILCAHALPLWSADSRRVAPVPALGVLAGGQTGIGHYVVLQIDTILDTEDRQSNSMK